MTGTIGFIIGALSITLFAVTSYKAYRFVDLRRLQLFASAFGFFAAAMALWALATASGNGVVVERALFASDALLLVGTAAMALTLVDSTDVFLVVGIGAIGAITLALRAFAYPPEGYVRDGLLYFNLNGGIRTVVLLAFVSVWLPAMIRLALTVARDPLLTDIGNGLIGCFIALALVSGLFLSARRSWVIITLFAFIAGLFLLISVVNMLIVRIHLKQAKVKPGKATHHATARR